METEFAGIELKESEQNAIRSFLSANPQLNRRPRFSGLPQVFVRGQPLRFPMIHRVILLAASGVDPMWLGRTYVGYHLDRRELVTVLGPLTHKDLPEDWLTRPRFDGVTWEQWFSERQIRRQRVVSPYIERFALVKEDDFYICIKPYPSAVRLLHILGQIRKSGRTGLEELDALQAVLCATYGLAALRAEDSSCRCRPEELLVPSSADRSKWLFHETQLADDAIYHMGTLPGAVPALPVAPAPKVVRFLDSEVAQNFALGETLYTLLCGRPPFNPGKQYAFTKAPLKEAHVPVDTIRPELFNGTKDLIDACLSLEPSQRPQKLSHLARELERCIRRLRYAHTV
jgi:serine/threonine protein kinase